MKVGIFFLLIASMVHASDETEKTIAIVNKTGNVIHVVHPEDYEVQIVLQNKERCSLSMDPHDLKSLTCVYFDEHNDTPILLRADDICITDSTEISITGEKDFERMFLAATLAKGKTKSDRKKDLRRSLTRSVSVEIVRYVMEQVGDKEEGPS